MCAGIDGWITDANGAELRSINPATGATIATVIQGTTASYDAAVASAQAGFKKWRTLPAPKRGELVRDLGNALREHKKALGELVSLENGKIRTEGLGEVQEMIDICDFAVGLSRQLYGLTMHSERARSSHVRAMASAGTYRRHHRLQLSRRRLVLERGHRGRLWRYHDLEALAHHAADCHRPFRTFAISSWRSTA